MSVPLGTVVDKGTGTSREVTTTGADHDEGRWPQADMGTDLAGASVPAGLHRDGLSWSWELDLDALVAAVTDPAPRGSAAPGSQASQQPRYRSGFRRHPRHPRHRTRRLGCHPRDPGHRPRGLRHRPARPRPAMGAQGLCSRYLPVCGHCAQGARGLGKCMVWDVVSPGKHG
jgi:hypothetical protein